MPDRSLHPFNLRLHQSVVQRNAIFGQVKQPPAPVSIPGALFNDPAFDQFLQHPRQALFGDAQNIKQFSHADAGIAPHKMHHTVMRPSEPEIQQQHIRIRGEIAVSKVQQLNQLNDGVARNFPLQSVLACLCVHGKSHFRVRIGYHDLCQPY